MKKKSLILLSLLCLCGCGYDPYELPEDLNIEFNANNYIIYNEINTKDFIKNTNAEVLNNTDITLNDLGKNTYTFELKYNKRKYKIDYQYEVKDITPPVFISVSSTKTVKVNDDFYPCESIVFADDVDNEPTCKVIGEYDLTKVGTYNITYQISDTSGNINTKDAKINVVNTISKSTSTTTQSKTQFSNVINNYKNENNMIGIDVSYWQGNIDFEKVKNAGCDFVIMRIAIQSNIDKEFSVDSKYKDNIKKAKDAGLLVGVYVYTSAINNDMAETTAKYVLDALDGETLDFPIAYDWENWSKFNSYKINLHSFNEAFNTFAKYIKKNGYDAMLYSSKFYLENIWTNDNNYPVWLANYTSKTTYEGKYILWQMSNTGRIDGINGDVDIDIYYK